MKYLTMCTYTDDLYSDDCPYKLRNEELEEENEELKKWNAEKQNYINSLRKENDELKESLRTITAMDHEEPCHQVEKLLNDVQDLTTKNRRLVDQNSFLSGSVKSLKNSCAQNENKMKSLEIDKTNLVLDLEQKTREAEYLEGKVTAYENILDVLKPEEP